MARKNNYLIYGDDDREQVENLDELAIGLNEAIGKEIEREKRLRQKKGKKYKPEKLNNKNYITPVQEDLLDINDDIQSPEVTENVPEVKQKEEVTEEKKKMNPAVWVLLACVAILFASIGTVLYRQYRNSHLETTPIETAEVIDNTEVAQPTVINGRLAEYNVNFGSDINTSLASAGNINGVIESYFGDIIDTVKRYNDGDNIEEMVVDYKKLIEYDKASLETYRQLFMDHNGEKYFNDSVARFNNISDMLGSFTDGMTKESLFMVANNFIRKENSLSANARESLIQFLDKNGIYYNDDSAYMITYDELQISGEADSSESGSTLEIQDDTTETPTPTEQPAQTEEPVAQTEEKDEENPHILIRKDDINVIVGTKNYDVKSNIIHVRDNVDGDLPFDEEMKKPGTYSLSYDIDFDKLGDYPIHMEATDSSGNQDIDDWVIHIVR